jgi:hypothetical protein
LFRHRLPLNCESAVSRRLTFAVDPHANNARGPSPAARAAAQRRPQETATEL